MFSGNTGKPIKVAEAETLRLAQVGQLASYFTGALQLIAILSVIEEQAETSEVIISPSSYAFERGIINEPVIDISGVTPEMVTKVAGF
ncbi:MAG: hypothetical protein ACE5DX_06260 [Candidatus Dojkabacteria bacterium]